MSRRRVGVVLLSAVVTASLAAGLTYAFWSTDAEASVGVVRSGDLDLELLGRATWAYAGPGATSPTALPTAADGTPRHLAVRGDTITLTQRFRTTLEGDNLRARVTVGWQTGPSLPSGVVGTYVVAPPSGAPTGPVPLGTAVELPGDGTVLTPGVEDWTLTVTLSWAAAADVVVHPSALASPRPAADLGALRIDLRQVRVGDGATS